MQLASRNAGGELHRSFPFDWLRARMTVEIYAARPFTASTTLRPISVVETAACVVPARSAVRAPCASTAETACSTHAASVSN